LICLGASQNSRRSAIVRRGLDVPAFVQYPSSVGIPHFKITEPKRTDPHEKRVLMDHAVKIDAQGRIAIPAAMRASLGFQTGDTLFAHLDEETGGIRLAKAINPFDLLFEHAVREYRAGRTTNLRDFLTEEVDEPEGDDESAIPSRTD
jgi:AbrB family looped-hinge helix DNA binding protein